MRKYKFLILRRISQLTIMILFFISNFYSIKILQGNLSFSLLFNQIPLADPYSIMQMFFAGATFSIDMILGFLIIFAFYGFFGGRAFCSWVCPINIISDFANFLSRKLKIKKDNKIISRNARYVILVVGLILSFIFGFSAFELVSPISILQRSLIFGFGFGIIVIIAIFTFDFLVLNNGWCGHLCPLGGTFSLIGKFSFIKINYDIQNCTSCMKCKLVCPEPQVLFMINKNTSIINTKECTKCARCIEVCEDDCLNFSITKFLKEKK